MDVKKTASGAGMMRALEGHAARPLFDDPLIEGMLTGWPAVVVGNRPLRRAFQALMERTGPGFYGSVICRTRVIDDACRQALADGVGQVVILGAGLDTRPYRMPEMLGARVWELDLPAVQAVKRTALAKVLPMPPAHVSYVPVDLARESVTIGGDRTLVIWEAVSMYLELDAIDRVLAYAGSLPPGSRIVLTYLPLSFADDPRHATWARRLRWRTAFDPPELAGRLRTNGLSVLADLGPEDHQERLLRPLGRKLNVSGGERVVLAEKGH